MPTTADYLSDLKAQKSALYAVLKAAGETVSEDETLDTLVPKVAKAIVDNKKYADDSFAPVIKNKVVGTDTLTVKDVSPIEHNLKVKVTPKVIFETIAEAETLEFEEYYTLNASQSIKASVCTLKADIVSTAASVVTAVLLNSESEEEGRFTLNVTPGVATEINEQLNLNNSLISEVILYEGTGHTTGEETFSGVSVTGLEITVSGYSAAPEEVSVSQYGKNLFDYKAFVDYCNGFNSGWAAEGEWLGENVFAFKNYRPSVDFSFMKGFFKEKTQYTLSFYSSFYYKTNKEYSMPSLVVMYTDGTSNTLTAMQSTGHWTGMTFTTDANKTVECLKIPNFSTEASIMIKKDFQLELGSKATGFEPYIKPVSVMADVNGNALMTSVSPSMTLCSDKENVEIELEYNADTKLYIDSKLG